MSDVRPPSSPADPPASDAWVDDIPDGRRESAVERYDRNWSEVLQELRVLQTGTQILTGFLLALAFQPAFLDLSVGQRTFYLILLVLSVLSAIIALAPVALHRALFRRHEKGRIVAYGHAALITALATVSVLLVGVVAFVFDVVVSDLASVITAIVLGLVILVLWIVVPLVWRVRETGLRAARLRRLTEEQDDR